MRDFEDLIRYELESTAVEFKAVQYSKDKFVSLLKDVLAMANADVEGDRYVVLGVKLNPDGSRVMLGVARDEFTDPAEYQQLIAQNIEPDLEVDYLPVEVDSTLFGVLRITRCNNPPYLMRKQYGELQQGDVVLSARDLISFASRDEITSGSLLRGQSRRILAGTSTSHSQIHTNSRRSSSPPSVSCHFHRIELPAK